MKMQIKDPSHKVLNFSEKKKIIEISLFQRLRSVSRLSFENLVFPGGNHSRFEHSLGVCHVASEYRKIFNNTPNKKEII